MILVTTNHPCFRAGHHTFPRSLLASISTAVRCLRLATGRGTPPVDFLGPVQGVAEAWTGCEDVVDDLVEMCTPATPLSWPCTAHRRELTPQLPQGSLGAPAQSPSSVDYGGQLKMLICCFSERSTQLARRGREVCSRTWRQSHPTVAGSTRPVHCYREDQTVGSPTWQTPP
jgi:hypothetical protein